jgi:integrase
VPFFGKYKLKDLTNEHGQNYIVEKGVDRTKKTIANHLIVFISMLNFAGDMKWIREVPKIRKPKIPKNGHVFTYLRDDEEIRIFLQAAKMQGMNVFVFYAMAIFTGMRAGELAGVHWVDIDFNTRRICVRNSFSNPTKSENVRYVPILDPLLPILKEWHSLKHSELVFTTNRGTMIRESARIFQEIFQDTLKLAGFKKTSRNGKEVHFIRMHDLRHTFASHWMMKGGDIYRLQKVLGHASIEMTQRYSHLSPHIYKDDYARFNTIDI